MNFNFSSVRMLGLFLASLLFAQFANAQSEGDPINEPIRPVKNNWGTHEVNTYIDGTETEHMCVELGPDNTLSLSLYVYVATLENFSNWPPMMFDYTLYGGAGAHFVSPQITNFQPMYTVNGTLIYRAKLDISYDCTALCKGPNRDGFPYMYYFTIEYQLVTPTGYNPETHEPLGYTPYNMSNETIWPRNLFDIPGVYDVVHSDMKALCCYHGPNFNPIVGGDKDSGMDIAESTKNGLSSNKSIEVGNPIGVGISANKMGNEVQVNPNPFSEEVAIQFVADEPGPIRLECLDAQGKLIKSSIEAAQTAGEYRTQFNLAENPDGLYYLRISTSGWTKTVKMIKGRN